MNKTKTFDAVKFMRAARDRMSREMMGMTPAEQIAYVRRHAAWHDEISTRPPKPSTGRQTRRTRPPRRARTTAAPAT